jgi:hypothetical protein
MRPILVALPLVLPTLASPLAAQWGEARLSEPRSGIAATRVGDFALFAGGRSGSLPSAAVDLFDQRDGSWSTASLSEARERLVATASGPLAFVAGGRAPGGMSSARVDIYDSRDGSWSSASLSVPRHDLAATAVGDLVLFAGGQNQAFQKFATVDIYNLVTGRWSVAELTEARTDLAATTAGGMALFAGGFWSTWVDMYVPGNGWGTHWLWEMRGGIGATSVGDRAIFAGGLDGGFMPTAVVDLFDVATGSWSVTSLSKARTRVAAVAIGGLAVFAGGWNEHGVPYSPDATLDLYDVVANRWHALALPAPRADLAAVALGDRVIFAGGLDSAQQPSDTIWIYRPPLAGLCYCFGADSDAACPCGNPAGADEGCRNSTGRGAALRAGGSASLGQADLRMEGEHLPAAQPVLLFAGRQRIAGGAGLPLGDGLRCAGVGVLRLGTRNADATGRVDFGPGLGAQAGAAPGEERRFQLWYRDPQGSPCGSGFNLSSAVEVLFAP